MDLDDQLSGANDDHDRLMLRMDRARAAMREADRIQREAEQLPKEADRNQRQDARIQPAIQPENGESKNE